MASQKELLEKLYTETPPDQIPWNRPDPPDKLVELVQSGIISSGKALDVGCGAGNYSIWLAKQGFDVTGVDLAAGAIKLAKDKAAQENVSCEFLQADLSMGVPDIEGDFDFVLEWMILHHVMPESREAFTSNIHSLMKKGGRYVCTCFHKSNTNFPGTGKYRETQIGTRLYFSGLDEIRSLYEKRFEILDLKTTQVPGRCAPHQVIYALLEKP